MATINTTTSLLSSIPNPTIDGYKLTMTCSATVNGSTLYVLKSRGSTSDNIQYPICIYKIANFTAKKPTITLLKIKDSNGKQLGGLARHANSITGIGSELYVATMNIASQPQALLISTSGVLKKKFYYKKNGVNATFNCFNYIGTENGYKKFILGIKRAENGRYLYDFALLKGNNFEYTGVSILGTPNSGWTANDIFYKDGKLYSVFFKKDASDIITYNSIYCYKISKVKKSTQLEPTDIIISNRPKKFDEKYEIESFFIYGSTWYGACNCESTNTTYNKDYVVKLTKK